MTQLEALKEIAKRDGGLLRPQAVVDAARDEESPLHNAFCWDDTEAANQYRLIQAQHLIRSFKITIEKNGSENKESKVFGCENKVPVFIGLSTDREGGCKAENPYRFAEDVAKDEDLTAVAVHDALELLRSIKERYLYLKQLRDIWEAIDAHEE